MEKSRLCKIVLNFEISQIEPKYYITPGSDRPEDREDAYEMKRSLTLWAVQLDVVPAKKGLSNRNGNAEPSNGSGNDNVIVRSI